MNAVGQKSGFTLVEVALAVLVVGLGLLAIFGLFPSGLRSVESSTGDTRSGLFAEVAFNGMRGRAAEVTGWGNWTNPATIGDMIWQSLPGPVNLVTGAVVAVQFPVGSGDYLRYRLDVTRNPAGYFTALLNVEDGQYPSGILPSPNTFYTEFSYLGP